MPSSLGGIDGLELAQFTQEIKFNNYDFSDALTRRSGAYRQAFAGTLNIEDFSVSFVSPSNGMVEDYFTAWRELIVDADGYYYPKNNYAKQTYARLLNTPQEVVSEYKLEGCFPKTLYKYDLSYTGEEFVKHVILFSVDNVIPI